MISPKCIRILLLLIFEESLLLYAFSPPLFQSSFTNEPVVSDTKLFAIEAEEFVDPGTILTDDVVERLEVLVKERSSLRWDGDYVNADLKRREIEDFGLPDGFQVVLKDFPRKEGGGSKWYIHSNMTDGLQEPLPGPTVLQLAHAALGLTVQFSAQYNLQRAEMRLLGNGSDTPDYQPEIDHHNVVKLRHNHAKALESIVLQCKERLLENPKRIAVELSGRKSADAAFWFAMAGVKDAVIFQELADIATDELLRFGNRPSCRQKDILQMLERFAASGVRSAPALEEVARAALDSKSVGDNDFLAGSDRSLLDYHSERPLLLIWKFSTKQKKQRAFLTQARKHWERHSESFESTGHTMAIDSKGSMLHSSPEKFNEYDWSDLFTDPTRPLVVDIGCGMGTSLLGLASTTIGAEKETDSMLDYAASLLCAPSTSWEDCNFIGADLGALGIAYAEGLSSRWGLDGKVAFVVDAAEDVLDRIAATYPGPVQLCCIQFPTPYRFDKQSLTDIVGTENDEEHDYKGNSQLPTSVKDGFMVTPKLLDSIRSALQSSTCNDVDQFEIGKLLFQSNCEDVAVTLRKEACDNLGFEFVEIPELVPLPNSEEKRDSSTLPSRLPKRTEDWVAIGGERAVGLGWAKGPVLHMQGRTETEVACILNGTPVHRCLLRPKDKDP